MSELTNRIRSKYPQYQNIPDQELESRVLAKYPQYKSLTSPQKSIGGFAKNVVTSGARLLGDTASAALNVFNPNMQKNTVANIARLTTGAAQLADPTRGNQIVSAIPGLGAVQSKAGNQERQAKAVGQFYKDRYGGIDNITNTLYNDPVGVVADAATVATGVGGALRGGGAVATKIGLAGKSNTLTKAGRTASNIGRTVDPIMVAGKGVGAVKTAGLKFGGRTKPMLASRADQMVTRGIGNPAQQAKLEKLTGRKVADFIDEYDLYDRSPDSIQSATKKIGADFDTRASSTTRNVEVGKVVRAFDDEIAKLSEGAGGQLADATRQKIAELQRRKQMYLDSIVKNDRQLFSRTTQANRTDPLSSLKQEARNKSQLAAGFNSIDDIPLSKEAKKMSFKDFNKEYGFYFEGDTSQNYFNGSAREFYNQSTTPKVEPISSPSRTFLQSRNLSSPLQVPMKQVTDFRRRVIDPDVPMSEFGLNPKEVGKAGGTKTSRDIFKRELQKLDPELKKLGMDYRMAKGLEPIYEASAARAANRQLLNFTKLGSAGIGGILGGVPGAVGGFAAERIINSPAFIKAGSKALRALSSPQSQSASKLTKAQRSLQRQLGNLQSYANPTTFNAVYQTGRVGRMADPLEQELLQEFPPELQTYIQELPQEEKSDLLDNIARAQGLDVEEMRKKRLNFRR